MNDLQHVIVDDHIADLLREGDTLRSERRFGSAPSGDDDVGASAARVRHRPARVRLGTGSSGSGRPSPATGATTSGAAPPSLLRTPRGPSTGVAASQRSRSNPVSAPRANRLHSGS